MADFLDGPKIVWNADRGKLGLQLSADLTLGPSTDLTYQSRIAWPTVTDAVNTLVATLLRWRWRWRGRQRNRRRERPTAKSL